MFYEMCGIDQGKSKASILSMLYEVKPLENGTLFELEEDETTQVWHPNWAGPVTTDMNAAFIKALVDHVWENEKVCISAG
jgi:hypothetical protein